MKKLYLSVCLVVLCMLQSFGQVPVLNSYTKAAPVIFLDFDGHHVSGTSWNWNGPFTCGPSGMKTAQIEEIFARVAEDYRPFNINVTTDSAKYWAAPAKSRARVVLTVTNEWYGSGAGGVASTGSFSRGDNTPCFVFTKLLSYNTKAIAEAAAHEAGHTLGLRHQAVYNDSCLRVSDYYEGKGTGEASWAPIMGNSYNRNVTTWHLGTSSRSCTSIQSDLDMILNPVNGVTYRADDHANFLTAATPLAFAEDSLRADGLIEQPADNDYFALNVKKTSEFRLEANPYSIGINNSGANLNVRVSLVDSNQKEVAKFESGSKLNKIIDTVLVAGNYYLKVDGSSGQYFSEYGSLGSYSLKGTLVTSMILPLRRLQLQGSAAGNSHHLRWEIDADEPVVSQTLEAATDGRSFQQVQQLEAAGRQWQGTGLDAPIVQYRLRVQLSGGREHLSNTITLRGLADNNNRPKLASNLITGTAINMASTEPFQYQITDMGGKVVYRGSGRQGNTTLPAANLAAGVYLVQFSWEGGTFVEKLLKK
jgi:hypothetical protein